MNALAITAFAAFCCCCCFFCSRIRKNINIAHTNAEKTIICSPKGWTGSRLSTFVFRLSTLNYRLSTFDFRLSSYF
ncbi:hypothetical protein CANARDRAFT_29030 [[Candida] arabinofermentans NRRL YB-2248]|uniref:Secreted protein n=1 Tax=[Candida] arabinofermentans NRRL YB-2248 TaxID=983967 RepID=A0A1E4SYD0_9ASCO|nr:hypothetical protein CANARDRAFT_29030 [[Candida] arabinofermentans NRRL YB-2248]